MDTQQNTPGEPSTPASPPTAASQTPAAGSPLAAPPAESGSPLSAPPAEGGDAGIGEAIPSPSVTAPEKPDAHGWWWGTGRRKSARARVRIKPGSGDIKIQVSRSKHKTVDEYFTELRDRNDVHAPMKVTQTDGKMDVVARLDGGGFMGQAQALRLGIARALRKYDPSLEGVLRDHGYLTRDAREVERKKYGLAGARRSFQFSKR
jgi:small subunit ribosomal protein S9